MDIFIKFGKFKKETFYKTDVKMSDETREIFLKYGRSRIINDEEKILDYAINKILEDSIPYFEEMLRRKKLKTICKNCIQFKNNNWQGKYITGCNGNPDNGNQGCKNFKY